MRSMNNSHSRSSFLGLRSLHGFTLIELLVVVSIIALLISILLPSLKRAKEHAKRAVCASNLHQLIIALHLYTEDNNGELPGLSGYQKHTLNYFRPGEGPNKPESNRFSDFSGLYPKYASEPDLYYCPSGPWRADQLIWPGQPPPWGETTWFYGFFAGHNIWGRYITYDYLGNSTMIDSKGNPYELPTDLNGRGDLVLMTDFNNNWGAIYQFSNHPANAQSGGAPYNPVRDGLNVGYVDGSADWKNEAETTAKKLDLPTGGWKKF